MALTFVFRDGERLTPRMLEQINRLDADIYARWGVHIIVSSGLRTYEEQKAIFLERYVTAGNINGRRVYDTRTWNGQTWYRISSAGTVATPGSSNHEVQGTDGAVDIRDTGGDAGITVASSARGRWIREVCANYDMVAEGDNFGEGWHFKMRNIDGGTGGGGNTGSGWPARDLYGEAWVTEIQKKANRLGAKLDVDGKDGPATQAWISRLQKYNGLDEDGVAGPATNEVLDKLLNLDVDGQLGFLSVQRLQYAFGAEPDGQWGEATSKLIQTHLGVNPDGQFGENSWKAFQRALKVDADGNPGTNTYKALQAWLNTGTYLAPVPEPVDPEPPVETAPGRNATDRPLKEIQAFLKIPQTGVWDKATSDAVHAYQNLMHIDADYVWGNTSDGLAFPPANFGFGVDYSFARPDPAVLKARGVTFAARYLFRLNQTNGTTNKGISQAEYDSLYKAGISVAFIYEEDGKELLGGFMGGVRVAKAAEEFRIQNNLPVKPIYFNVDYDAPAADMAVTIEALKGIASVIGLKRVGLYGGFNVIKAAFDAGVITWGMQTYAWSNGQWDSRAQLRQWSNGQYGGSVDFQYAMAKEFGQTPIVDVPDPEEPEVVVTREELIKQRAAAVALVAFFDKLLESVGA